MPAITGRRLGLSLPRRWIIDLMHASRGMPIVTAERRMNLAAVVAARQRGVEPPPWSALFLKAYALVAARRPALRQAYLTFPWPHLFEADQSIASLAVARDYQGEPAVFFALLPAPERQSLRQLAEQIRDFQKKPVDQIRTFARLIRYTSYPRPLRRFLWWLGLNLSGRHRAKTIGTFGLSTVGSMGVGLVSLISPVATTLSYGPLAADGSVEVRLNFDHRVLDGATAAMALIELERVLVEELAPEVMAEGRERGA